MLIDQKRRIMRGPADRGAPIMVRQKLQIERLFLAQAAGFLAFEFYGEAVIFVVGRGGETKHVRHTLCHALGLHALSDVFVCVHPVRNVNDRVEYRIARFERITPAEERGLDMLFKRRRV